MKIRTMVCACTLAFCASGAQADVNTVIFNGTVNNVGVLNWANGDWYVRAIQIDDMGNEVGALTPEITFNLMDTWPSFKFTRSVDPIPAGHFIRVYRSQSPINSGAGGIDFIDFECPTGICNDTDDGSVAIANSNTNWMNGTVVPVELMQFDVE